MESTVKDDIGPYELTLYMVFKCAYYFSNYV